MDVQRYLTELAWYDRPTTEAVASWGRDGWDLGEWPYVVIRHGESPDGFVVETVVEGDRDFYVAPDRATRDSITDYLAWFYWNRRGEFTGTFDEMPPERRGPFSWERLDREKGGE